MTNLADKLLEYGAASATMPAPRREPGPRPGP